MTQAKSNRAVAKWTPLHED